MERPFWKNEEIYREMEGLDLEAVLNTTLLSDVTVLCLTHGNTNSSIVSEAIVSYIVTITITIVCITMAIVNYLWHCHDNSCLQSYRQHNIATGVTNK